MKVPITDPMEYLLRRKFGFFPTATARVDLSADRLMRKAGEATRQAFEAYKAELKAKSPEEIRTLYKEELARERAEEKQKADQEERARFFHKPSAEADFDHWSKAAYWTLDEAVALSFGKAPEAVNWKTVEPYLGVSPFAKQYGRVRDLALRAIHWEQIYDPVLPGIFLAWTQRTGIVVSPELVAAVTARGVQIADWKTLYDDLSKQAAEKAEASSALIAEQKNLIERLTAQVESLLAERDAPQAEMAKEISTRERDSLLKLIIGMAVSGYRYDPAQKRSDKLPEIVSDLERAGVPLGADTVRKWLKQAAELLPPEQTE